MKNLLGKALLIFLGIIYLSSCDEYQNKNVPARANLLASLSNKFSSNRTNSKGKSTNTSRRSGRIVRTGTNELLGEINPGRPLVSSTSTGEISLNLVNVPIADAAKAILGTALKLNYTLDENIDSKITLQTTKPIAKKRVVNDV